jgi:hypothetical protein
MVRGTVIRDYTYSTSNLRQGGPAGLPGMGGISPNFHTQRSEIILKRLESNVLKSA